MGERVSRALGAALLPVARFAPAHGAGERSTGFDIESFIFCFAIGGIGSVLYNALARRELHPVPATERYATRHRLHALALMTPYFSFPLLYALPWNVIYAGITALAIGATLNVLCRPELGRKTLLGGSLLLVLYAAFMVALVVFAPGYIDQVWNLADLSGVLIAGIPLEELAFGFAFGTYWAGLYEHFSWRTAGAQATSPFASSSGHHV